MTILELENFIAEYGRDIYSFCRYLTRDRQEADELYQDTFLRAVEHRGRIDIRENPKGYLLSMTVRLWKDRQRKAARRQRIAPLQSYVEGWEDGVGDGEDFFSLTVGTNSTEAAGNPPEAQILQGEMKKQVRQAVAELAEKYRIVVLLFYMEELDVAQIAELLNIPVGTVKSRLFHARKQLKRKLECVYDG